MSGVLKKFFSPIMYLEKLGNYGGSRIAHSLNVGSF